VLKQVTHGTVIACVLVCETGAQRVSESCRWSDVCWCSQGTHQWRVGQRVDLQLVLLLIDSQLLVSLPLALSLYSSWP